MLGTKPGCTAAHIGIPIPDKENVMLALLKDVPVISHPVFRIVLGAALVAIGLLVLHHSIILIVIGALLFVMGVVRGVTALARHAQKG
jgi:uncharacterized membrane protein HdeD (DUF308 family)